MAKKIDLRVNKALLKRAMKPYGLALDSDGQCVTDHMGNRVPVPLADRVVARLPEMYSRIAALYVNPFVRSQQVLALMACVSAAMPRPIDTRSSDPVSWPSSMAVRARERVA